MQRSHTAFFSVSILALGLIGYTLMPGAMDVTLAGGETTPPQPDSQAVEDCGALEIDGAQGCVRASDAASAYGQLRNEDGSTTVWSLIYAEQGETQIQRYRDLLLTSNGRLEYETVITVERGPEGVRELREVRNADGEKVFHEVRRHNAESGEIAVEQLPLTDDPEDVIAVLQRATHILQQAMALSPAV